MTNTCPVCGREQGEGLLCHACTTVLERALGDVAAIVADLDISMSKQAKIGNASGSAGLARERTPIGLSAMQAADVLANTLTTWARDIGEIELLGYERGSRFAAAFLLSHIPEIRRHPAVNELVDEVADAIAQARRAVDRPADRVFVGPCLAAYEDTTCSEDLYARVHATHVRCRVCGTEHDVTERRKWLLREAEDRIVTVREAAQWVGRVGNMDVTEDRIRGYLRRKTLTTRPLPSGVKAIRLGDLLALVHADSEKRSKAG